MSKQVLKHFSILKRIIQFLMCLIFAICFIYGYLQTNFQLHNLDAISKVLRIFNHSGSIIKNVSTVCVYKNICYKKVDKKCFFLSSTKDRTIYYPKRIFDLNELKSKSYFRKLDISNGHLSINKSRKTEYNSPKCNRFITMGAYMGRIGNQMFEIASLLGTAYKYDVIPLIPANYPITKYFDLPNLVKPGLNKLLNVVKCIAKKSAMYYNCTKEMNTGKNISMHGYLQSWKYFYEAYDVIKNVFKLKQKHLLNAQSFLSHMSLDGYKRVCIHVRRGDITSLAKQKEGYAIAGLDFIEKARQFYRNKYLKVQFLVVSDDKTWCRRHIKGVYFSTFTDPGDDLALMALSDDVVVTTGTFGWWGAWLSGGTTVYFNKHPRRGSVLASKISNEDFYPPNWIGLS